MGKFQPELFTAFKKAQQKKYKNESSLLNGGDDIPSVQVIPIGDPIIDKLLAGQSPVGGIIRGGVNEISGGFSSGKTTLALEWLAQAMKLFPDRAVAFIDVEHSFDAQYAAHIGVDIEDPRFVFSAPKNGQEAVTLMRDLADTGMFSMIVVDSWAALIPPRQENAELLGQASIGDLARLGNDSLPQISTSAKHNDCTIIILNQERVNMTPMGARGKKTTGGNPIVFYTDMRLSVNKESKDGDERVISIVKAKSQALPWTEANITIKHGVGLDRLESLISLAIEQGHIVTGGAGWMTLNIDKAQKVQGRDKLCKLLIENEETRNHLCKLMDVTPFVPRTMLIRKKIGDANEGTNSTESSTD